MLRLAPQTLCIRLVIDVVANFQLVILSVLDRYLFTLVTCNPLSLLYWSSPVRHVVSLSFCPPRILRCLSQDEGIQGIYLLPVSEGCAPYSLCFLYHGFSQFPRWTISYPSSLYPKIFVSVSPLQGGLPVWSEEGLEVVGVLPSSIVHQGEASTLVWVELQTSLLGVGMDLV